MSSKIEFRIEEVPLDKIIWPEERLRSLYSKEDFEILKKSINRIGVVNEIILAYDKERDIYIGIDGQNRYEILKEQGVEKVKAKVIDYDEKTALLLEIQLNYPKPRIADWYLAKRLHLLASKYHMSSKELAELSGLSRSTVTKLLWLVSKADKRLKEELEKGTISVWHAIELLRVHDLRDRMDFLDWCITYNWSIPQLRESIDRYLERVQNITERPRIISREEEETKPEQAPPKPQQPPPTTEEAKKEATESTQEETEHEEETPHEEAPAKTEESATQAQSQTSTQEQEQTIEHTEQTEEQTPATPSNINEEQEDRCIFCERKGKKLITLKAHTK
ncbi:MAG: ParB/RepB/Spo0J family partition protein, partial [Candidatus Nezhaarchaeales archaeon]